MFVFSGAVPLGDSDSGCFVGVDPLGNVSLGVCLVTVVSEEEPGCSVPLSVVVCVESVGDCEGDSEVICCVAVEASCVFSVAADEGVSYFVVPVKPVGFATLVVVSVGAEAVVLPETEQKNTNLLQIQTFSSQKPDYDLN